MVMVLEEVFEIEIHDDALHLGSPREMVDLLERHLSNQRPNEQLPRFSESSRKASNGQN
jgi:hypothetical protein